MERAALEQANPAQPHTTRPFPVVCPSAVSTLGAMGKHSFSSDKSYASPAADVRLKVSYRGPNQPTINGLGFW